MSDTEQRDTFTIAYCRAPDAYIFTGRTGDIARVPHAEMEYVSTGLKDVLTAIRIAAWNQAWVDGEQPDPDDYGGGYMSRTTLYGTVDLGYVVYEIELGEWTGNGHTTLENRALKWAKSVTLPPVRWVDPVETAELFSQWYADTYQDEEDIPSPDEAFDYYQDGQESFDPSR